jgi:hypothetical protein
VMPPNVEIVNASPLTRPIDTSELEKDSHFASLGERAYRCIVD